MPFEIAEPVAKKDFLDVYKDSVAVTQLIFAPFGLSSSVVDILGETNAMETYTSMFQQWEDLVSKRIFSARGFDDDRIIASMHKFISKAQDSEVISEVRIASDALKNMLTAPTVVEFDFPAITSTAADKQTMDLCSASTAALLLDKVLNTLQSLYDSDGCDTNEKIDFDGPVKSTFDISLPTRVFNPARHYSSKTNSVFKKLSMKEFIHKLCNSLVLTVEELQQCNNSANSSTATAEVTRSDVAVEGGVESVTFSLQQYYALLDVHAKSPEINAVLAKHCVLEVDTVIDPLGMFDAEADVPPGTMDKTKAEESLLHSVHMGKFLTHLNHANLHPVVLFKQQLTAMLPHTTVDTSSTDGKKPAAASEKDKDSKNEDEESGEDSTSPDSESKPVVDEPDNGASTREATAENSRANNEATAMDSSAESNPKSTLSSAQLACITESLDLCVSAIHLMAEAKQASMNGDLDTAIDCISQVINKCNHGDNGENGENNGDTVTTESHADGEVNAAAEKGEGEGKKKEEEEEEEFEVDMPADKDNIVIPVYLKVQLYIERATYYAEQNEFTDALEDINIAITLDPFNANAYSLRSQIASAKIELQEAQGMNGGDGDEGEESEDEYVSPYERMMYGSGGKKKKTKSANKNKTTSTTEDGEREGEEKSEQVGDELAENGLKKSKSNTKHEVTKVTAAEDALTAFLLGGCSDLELAAAAEETAREQCRLSAKDIFMDRLKPTTGNNDDILTAVVGDDVDSTTTAAESATTAEPSKATAKVERDNWPRSWLVGSYFSGYTLLSTALDVYPTEEEIAEAKAADKLKKNAQSSTSGGTGSGGSGDGIGAGGIEDICEGNALETEKNSNGAEADSSLPVPPGHLLDPKPVTEEAAAAVPVSTSTESLHDIDDDEPVAVAVDDSVAAATVEGSSEGADGMSKDGLNTLDKEGYALLMKVVTALETATYSSNNNFVTPANATANANAADVKAAQAEEEPEDVNRDVVIIYDIPFTAATANPLDELDPRVDSECKLVDQGICESDDALRTLSECVNGRRSKEVTVSGGDDVVLSESPEKDAPPAAVVDSPTANPAAVVNDFTVKQAGSTGDVNVNPPTIGQPCPHFKAAVSLLASAYELTGVKMTAEGTVASLDYDTFHSAYTSRENCGVEGADSDADDGDDHDDDENEDGDSSESDDDEDGEDQDEEDDEERAAFQAYMEEIMRQQSNINNKQQPKRSTTKAGKKNNRQDKKSSTKKQSAKASREESDSDDSTTVKPSKDDSDSEDEDEDHAYKMQYDSEFRDREKEWNINDMHFDEHDDDEDDDEDYVPEHDGSDDDDDDDSTNTSVEVEAADKHQEVDVMAATDVTDASVGNQLIEKESTVTAAASADEEVKVKSSTAAATATPVVEDGKKSKVQDDDDSDDNNEDQDDDDDEGAWEDCSDDGEEDEEEDGSDEDDTGDWESIGSDDGDEDKEEEVKPRTKSAVHLKHMHSKKTQHAKAASSPLKSNKAKADADSLADLVDNLNINGTTESTATTPAPVLPSIKLSHKLRARLLNVCGSIAYLSGDAVGAVACLRASLLEDRHLLDSKIKLGSLLIDMDEQAEATKLLRETKKSEPNNAVVLLHLGELYINKNNFEAASRYLRKAQRVVPFYHSNRNSYATITERDRIERVAIEDIQANITALLGITMFRLNPSRPDIAIHILSEGLSEHPNSVILLICSGEVNSQAGDMVNALQCFRKANRLDGRNPLPFINAARTYQQLGQLVTASAHLEQAIALDPALSMTRVDIAQNYMQMGRTDDALDMINTALTLARQVSEIRDVLTAKSVALMQSKLEKAGLYIPMHDSV